MSEPIIEQIAIWLKEALAEITCANGYQQDLDVSRPEDRWLDSKYSTDLSTVIVQSSRERGPGTTTSHYEWEQGFEVHVNFLAEKDATVSMDTRMNRACADIEKRVGSEMAARLAAGAGGRCCNGLARAILLGDSVMGILEEEHCSELAVELIVIYRVSSNDPYTS